MTKKQVEEKKQVVVAEPAAPAKEKSLEDDEATMTATQIADRKERTLFVGNVSLETTQKDLKRHFKTFGAVEKVRFRSIATQQDTKQPERAKIITGKFGAQKDNKNAYVVFAKREDSVKALALNQQEFLGKHLRVDSLVKSPDAKKNAPKDDFDTTVFVGNLPYVVSEEDVRATFAKYGGILNVRLVRDPKTYLGKGIGYVQFADAKIMKEVIEATIKFKGRDLRLKRATDPKKRDKKANRKQKALDDRRAARAAEKADESDSESDGATNLQRNFEDNYSSDDSEDEKIPKHIVALDGGNKGEKPAREKKPVDDAKEKELKLKKQLAFNQRKKQDMLREMISKASKGISKPAKGKANANGAETKKPNFKDMPYNPAKKFSVKQGKHIAKHKANQADKKEKPKAK
jgi:RNA recognition motif-containing protein